jgi:hypothetical protein
VVGDAGQIALAAAVGDLVAADRDQTVQPRVIEVIGDDARDDRADRVPRDPEQPGDRRLGHLLREERHEVLEVARVAGPGARPRHRLKPRPAACRTPKAAQLALNPAAAGAEVEMPPALDAAVVDRQSADLAAARAHAPTSPQPDRDDHALARERDTDHRSARQAKHPVECGADAHVALLR